MTLAVARRQGTNASVVAQAVLDSVNSLRGGVIPDDLQVAVTLDSGETAKEKLDDAAQPLVGARAPAGDSPVLLVSQ